MTARGYADRVAQARQQTQANARVQAMEAALAQQQQASAEKLSAANKASERALQVQVEEMDALRRLLHLMASRSDRAAETRAAKQVCARENAAADMMSSNRRCCLSYCLRYRHNTAASILTVFASLRRWPAAVWWQEKMRWQCLLMF